MFVNLTYNMCSNCFVFFNNCICKKNNNKSTKINLKTLSLKLKRLYVNNLEECPTINIFEDLNTSITDECAICLQIFSPHENVLVYCCKHVFHCECIEQWLNKSKFCPICRNSK